jgi:hypothetical protein
MDVAATGPPLGASASHLAESFSHVRTEVIAAAAEKLGISVDRLRAEVAAGKPLSDLMAIASASHQSVAVVDEAHGSRLDLRL